jgi:hypothetical protein
MSTIDELIDDLCGVGVNFVQDGSFKVKSENWDYSYFVPYFKSDLSWFGLDLDGDQVNHFGHLDNWEIYEEPKPKVKHWLWTNSHGDVRFASDTSKLDNYTWTKIPGSEVEI